MDGTPIKVVYPPVGNWTTTVPVAIDAWNSGLHNVGLTGLTYEGSPGGTCTDNAHCIIVGFPSTTGVLCRAGDCACSRMGVTSGGTFTTSPVVTIVAEWGIELETWAIS